MQCNEARQRLENPGPTQNALAADSELEQHLQGCEHCRDYARELQVVALLAELPIREPLPGMEARVMQHALGRFRSTPGGVHARWALATAASVILAVVVTLQFYPAGGGQVPAAVPAAATSGALQPAAVRVVPGQTHNVDIRLSSARALDDVLIKVELDDNLALEGYRNVHNLEWRASLKRGINRLSLPVRLLQDRSGKITVTVEHGGSSKRFSLEVTTEPEKPVRKLSMV